MVAKVRNENGGVMVTGRLSFPALAQPERYAKDPNSKPRYAIKLLLEKGSPEEKLVQETVVKLMKKKFGEKIKDEAKINNIIKGILGNSQKCCLSDGDTVSYAGYDNMTVVSAYSPLPNPRPLCLDVRRQVMSDPDEIAQTFYSGCYIHAQLNFWVQDSDAYGKAIRCSIGGVMFAKDGDRFGGSAVSKPSDFDEIEIEAPDAENDFF